VFFAVLLAAARVQANGALPATIRVLAPAGAPATTLVTTNFGVISTTDDGGHWHWICEHDQGLQGAAYQLSGQGLLLALAGAGLVASDDLACGWRLVLDRQNILPLDFFPDPQTAGTAVVLGIDRHQQLTYQLVDVDLLGAGPPRVLFTAPTDAELTTVEVARASAHVLYATLRPPDPTAPAALVRSFDGGGTWDTVMPTPPVRDLGILAIDAAHAETIYFRVRADAGDELLISEDGGQTLRTARAPGHVMSAFLQLPNGHILVGWLDVDRGYLDRSEDGGGTFTTLPTTLHIGSLAERNGHVYGAVDYFADGYVLAGSDDEGTSWRRLMGLGDVVASDTCAAADCASTCQSLVTRKVFTASSCNGGRPDGGSADALAGDDGPAPTDGPSADGPSADAASADASVAAVASADGGCSCGVGRTGGRPGAPLLLLLALVLLGRRRRRSRATTAAPTSSG